MNFALATQLGIALWGGADAYDRWAQAEQARLLLDYAHWIELAQDGGCSPRAMVATSGGVK